MVHCISRLPFGVLLAVAAMPCHAQEPGVPGPTLAAQVEAFAASVEAISYGEFVCGRFGPPWAGSEPDLDRFAALHAEARPVAETIALLQHRDPKVRGIALMMLFDREEPQYLPRIASFVGDGAAAIPGRVRGSVAWDGNHMLGEPWIKSPRAVGEVAQQLLGFYYRCQHDLFWAAPVGDPVQQFDAWWRARRERTHCAGWLRVRLLRAYGGSSPVRENVAERLARVRAAVDALPSPDREFLLLGLPDANFDDLTAFASEAARIAAAKRLGDEVLLQALAGVFPSDDPDLPLLLGGPAPGAGEAPLPAFLLSPDRQIFAPASAERLLALEATQNERARRTTGCASAGWVTTAASLQPQRATVWLTAAFDRFRSPHDAVARTKILQALVRFGDEASEHLVTQRFWSDEMVAMFGAQMREWLLDAIVARGGDKAERLVGALLAEPAFVGVDPPTLIALARAVGSLRGQPVITEDEIRATHHPLGLHSLVRKDQLDQAKASHPDATARGLATTAGWQQAVVARWRQLPVSRR